MKSTPWELCQVLLDAPCSGESLTRREGETAMLDHPAGYVEGLQGCPGVNPGNPAELDTQKVERVVWLPFRFKGLLFMV